MDEDLISEYFYLNKRIVETDSRINSMHDEFYRQTMSSYCTYDDEKMYTIGFPVEKKVITLVDTESLAKKKLDLLKFKQKHFLRYMKQLTSADRDFLTHKYEWQEEGMNERLERECFDEVLEIEEAAGYHFMWYEPYIHLEEIEEVSSESYGESLENCFEKMIAKLGVMEN